MTPEELKISIINRGMRGLFFRDSEWVDNENSVFKYVWEVTGWDKKFQEVEKFKQKKVFKYSYVLAKDFEKLEVPNGNILLLSTGKYVGYTDENKARGLVSEGEVVTMPWGGGPTIKYYSGKFVTADNRIATSLDKNILLNKFFYYFMLSKTDELDSYYRGTSLRHPKMKLVLEMRIPIPEIEEQKRIVAKIEELLSLVDKYEEAWTKLEKFNNQFPIDMEKSIFKSAVEGKLTLQNEDDIAINLLNKIRASRNIETEEITGDLPLLPSNWCYCHLGEIVDVKGGKRIPAGRKLITKNNGHVYIRVSDMKNNTVKTDNLLYVPEDIYPLISRYTISKEDVYITVAGTIGDSGIIPDELDGANLTENADKLVLYSVNKKWLMYVLKSDFIQKQIKDSTTKVGQPKLAIKRIEQLIIPLPPLEEQKRIVAKIEELVPLCRSLK